MKWIRAIIQFLFSKKYFFLIAGIAAGLYPLLHYYNNNFTLSNSWYQLRMFITTYLLLPLVLMYFSQLLCKHINVLKRLNKYVITTVNIVFFVGLATLSLGCRKKIIALAVLIAFIISFFLFKHIKKIVVIQLLLAFITLPRLVPDVLRQINHNALITQPDHIEAVTFKKKPNIYVLQPDGYANFKDLKKPPYSYNNAKFEAFLTEYNFKLYTNYRSNYFSTLSSNTSLFSMKHHYYGYANKEYNELYNARNFIVGNNPVLSIFKNNNYKTFLLLQKPYLLINRPKIVYDYCNIKFSDFPFNSKGMGMNKNIVLDLKREIDANKETHNFFFLEKIKPGHISTRANTSKGIEKERDNYFVELEEANSWLKDVITIINAKDPNAIIIITADHGGFVGMHSTQQCFDKPNNNALIRTVFTSALAVKWPNNEAPKFDTKLETPVNLFRILFTYLSEDQSLLQNLQENKSYSVIKNGAPIGVYELIDENNKEVFKPLNN